MGEWAIEEHKSSCADCIGLFRRVVGHMNSLAHAPAGARPSSGNPWSPGRGSWHRGMVLAGLGTAIGVLVLATVAGLWWRRRDGRLRTVVPAGVPDHLAYLGVVAGTPVALLQFSSAFCAPCRTTRHVCADGAQRFDGVAQL